MSDTAAFGHPHGDESAWGRVLAESSLLDLTDDKGRRILVPGERLGYVDLGSPSARAVGFGAV